VRNDAQRERRPAGRAAAQAEVIEKWDAPSRPEAIRRLLAKTLEK
jgi:hypothetical protein